MTLELVLDAISLACAAGASVLALVAMSQARAVRANAAEIDTINTEIQGIVARINRIARELTAEEDAA